MRISCSRFLALFIFFKILRRILFQKRYAMEVKKLNILSDENIDKIVSLGEF